MSVEQTEVRREFERLKNQPLHYFPKDKGWDHVTTRHGVYIIYSPREKNVIHVGRTYRGKGGLRRRIRNHLHAQSSFAQQYLKGKGALLKKGYMFRFMPITSPRERALVEMYATGYLCPFHLGTGKNKPRKAGT